MSSRRVLTTASVRNSHFAKLSIFAFFVGLFIMFGSASDCFAQDGNMYEEPWHPAARFAVKEAAKKEKATIKLTKIEDASFTTAPEGLTFNICLAIDVKKGRKKTVKQYAETVVFRDDKTMLYTLKSWKMLKTPSCVQPQIGNPSS